MRGNKDVVIVECFVQPVSKCLTISKPNSKIEMMEIPIAQLFVAGTLAITVTELVKWFLGITESRIGLHSSHNGRLVKARTATIIYAFLILFSNLVAFYTYNYLASYLSSFSFLTSLTVDSIIIIMSVILVWIYLKTNHYSRD